MFSEKVLLNDSAHLSLGCNVSLFATLTRWIVSGVSQQELWSKHQFSGDKRQFLTLPG